MLVFLIVVSICVAVYLMWCLCQRGKVDETDFYCSPLWYGNFPNVNDCQTFYMCLGGHAMLLLCSNDAYYDEELRACVADASVCGDRPIIKPG
ncbi:hypothetical protein CalGV038 [Clostera anastomosis granulovirus A]|uniref:Chitin-binding type-2 domain-containing protein n=1 Tax=Clostera anastomosis granulovirus A TaxID=1986289 RepID=U5KAS6_9BBAC|nr:hypothetical protein CalGV038 [Clostera anastomosis granulovirus Henan]AGQ20297.1 hypothetical protein CalGV038 [Clostera anastomosis granulovirus Henan]